VADARIDIDNAALEAVLLVARRGALEETQAELVGAAQQTVHVITGNLRRNIKRGDINADATEAEVVADTDYAVYEALGTRYRPPHNFFTEAIDILSARNAAT
jgi:hypothetical protein